MRISPNLCPLLLLDRQQQGIDILPVVEVQTMGKLRGSIQVVANLGQQLTA
ncbi:hypothetical protein D3C78_1898140 [compost metagenome]